MLILKITAWTNMVTFKLNKLSTNSRLLCATLPGVTWLTYRRSSSSLSKSSASSASTVKPNSVSPGDLVRCNCTTDFWQTSIDSYFWKTKFDLIHEAVVYYMLNHSKLCFYTLNLIHSQSLTILFFPRKIFFEKYVSTLIIIVNTCKSKRS